MSIDVRSPPPPITAIDVRVIAPVTFSKPPTIVAV
jgi:hypothetical protein